MYVVRVLLVGLYITPKLKSHLLVVIHPFPSDQYTWRLYYRYAVKIKKGIQPEHGIGNQLNNDKMGYLSEGKQAVCTSYLFFRNTNVLFDLRHMFIFCAEKLNSASNSISSGTNLGLALINDIFISC